jgi:hypothetical protein
MIETFKKLRKEVFFSPIKAKVIHSKKKKKLHLIVKASLKSEI